MRPDSLVIRATAVLETCRSFRFAILPLSTHYGHSRTEAATLRHACLVLIASLSCASVWAQSNQAIQKVVSAQRAAYLQTLEALVSIESGSYDIEGLTRIAELIAGRLRSLGGETELLNLNSGAERFDDTPEEIGPAVSSRFVGTGSVDLLLLAHIDTVYERGMGSEQPFRIDGDRVYGLGIADDKHGVALILHTIEVLQAMNFNGYGTISVLINSDEEVSSPGSRFLLEQMGSEHDVVLSYEGAPIDALGLATSGIGAITLRVTGQASHAGERPEDGRNALYELAHHILRMRELSRPDEGVKVNWTVAKAGSVRNAIPAYAEASADVRVTRVSDWYDIEQQVQDLVGEQLIPDTAVEVVADFRRPPLEMSEESLRLANHLAELYSEIGYSLEVVSEPIGGGTDAAFAALSTDAPVIEGMGVTNFGSHSNNQEYIHLEAIEPRLFLSVRSIVDISRNLESILKD